MGLGRTQSSRGYPSTRRTFTVRLALLSAILVGISLLARPAQASPCDRAYQLAYGFAAPCTGVLWPEIWSKKALECIEVDLPELNAELARRIVELQAELTAGTTTLTACRTALDACERSVEDVVQPEREWWRHPALWAMVGFVGAGLIFGGAWVIHANL